MSTADRPWSLGAGNARDGPPLPSPINPLPKSSQIPLRVTGRVTRPTGIKSPLFGEGAIRSCSRYDDTQRTAVAKGRNPGGPARMFFRLWLVSGA